MPRVMRSEMPKEIYKAGVEYSPVINYNSYNNRKCRNFRSSSFILLLKRPCLIGISQPRLTPEDMGSLLQGALHKESLGHGGSLLFPKWGRNHCGNQASLEPRIVGYGMGNGNIIYIISQQYDVWF